MLGSTSPPISTYVLAYGMPGDLDVIEAMYGSVAVQMVTAAGTWVALGTWREESYVSVRRVQGRSRRMVKPHTAFTARVAFYRGYVARIAERLEQARASVINASPDHRSSGGSAPGVDGTGPSVNSADAAGRALVLKQKADEIRDYHRATSKARGTWSGYSGSMRGDRGSATGAGRQAASLARLGSQRGLPGKKPVQGSAS